MDSIYRIRLPFRDIDMHGHMHNAAYVSHFEAALGQTLRAHGLEQAFSPKGAHVFLVRKVEVTYTAPCLYDQEIAISTKLARLGRSSLNFACEMTSAGQRHAQAEIVWVCVQKASGQTVEVPADLRDRLAGLT